MKKKDILIGTALAGVFGSMAVAIVSLKNQVDDLFGKRVKFQQYYQVLNSWMDMKLDKTKPSVAQLFLDKGYRKIAIYGMGGIGQNLLKELKDSEVEVAYGIDIGRNDIIDIDIYVIDDDLAPVDAIVVTAMYDFEDIKKRLQQQTDSKIVSLDDIIL